MNIEINTILINEYLWKNKLTKTQFCKECGISYNVLNKILNGKNNLNMKPLVKICRTMNVYLKDIFKKD